MKATYLDQKGQEQFMVMGCYGIGIGRTVAASIEQNHDDAGIIWPLPIAPYHVIVTPVNVKDKAVYDTSEKLYLELMEKGIDVILDDRDERAGVKFKDADLIGIPVRITVGSKKLSTGFVEAKIRKSGDVLDMSPKEVVEFIIQYIREGT